MSRKDIGAVKADLEALPNDTYADRERRELLQEASPAVDTRYKGLGTAVESTFGGRASASAISTFGGS